MSIWSLEDEGRQAVELSQTYCDTCRDYHLTRAFLKASGHQLGPERDQPLFAPFLRRLTPPGARILIAGAADTGVLAATLSAISYQTPHITVADRCRTPLILCERFAASQGVHIDVAAVDLVTSKLGTFDVIIGHVVLNFIVPEQRFAFLRNMASMLAPGGTFLLVMTVRPPGPRRPRTTLEQVLAGLHARSIGLPRDGTLVTQSLQRQLDPARPQNERVDVEAAEQLFHAAGLSIGEVLDTARERPQPDPSVPSRLYFALRRAGV